MSMRDILERPSDGEVFDTAQIFIEGWNDTLNRHKVTLSQDAKYSQYESNVVSPGSNENGYNVKDTVEVNIVYQVKKVDLLANKEDLTSELNELTLKKEAELVKVDEKLSLFEVKK